MGVTIAVTRVACPTGTGTQDITTSKLGGLTPKAAIFLVSRATADGTPAADYGFTIGAVTGASNRWSVYSGEVDNLTDTDTDACTTSSACIYIGDPGQETQEGSADFSQWLTNGIRINWTDAPAAAYLMTVIFFAGTDLSAYAGYQDVTDTVDTEHDVTAPGFEPDILFVAGDRVTPATSINRNAWGIVHNDGVGGVTQRSIALYDLNNQVLGYNGLGLTDNGGLLTMTNGTVFDWWAEFANFDSSGFSIYQRNNGGNNQRVYYLALSFGGAVSSWVGTYQTPTSTGNDSETGPGFQPQFIFLLGNQTQTIDTGSDAGPIATTLGFCAIDDTDQYCTAVASEDAADPTNTQSLSDDQAINLPDDDGTARVAATLVSMNADGWTFNYTATGSNPFLFPALAIEGEGGACVTTVVDVEEVTVTVVAME